MEIENCAESAVGRSISGNHGNRRITKSVMEKKRRARINTSLTELKNMLATMAAEKPEKFDKLEKADILELTVQYVKQLQKAPMKEESPTPDDKYRRGFNSCFNEVLKYISASDSCKPELRAKVLSHLVDNFTNQNTNNARQSRCDTRYRSPGVLIEDRNEALSVLIPNQNNINTNYDQNNNVELVSAFSKENRHTSLAKNARVENDTVSGSLTAGEVKVTNPTSTSLMQEKIQILRCDTASVVSGSPQFTNCNENNLTPKTVQCMGPDVTAVTATPTCISRPKDTQIAQSPAKLVGNDLTIVNSNACHFAKPIETQPTPSLVQLVGCNNLPLNPSPVSLATPSVTPLMQSPVQYIEPSATQLLSPVNVNGQLTILVPANVIALRNPSPTGSAFLLTCGSNVPSPTIVSNDHTSNSANYKSDKEFCASDNCNINQPGSLNTDTQNQNIASCVDHVSSKPILQSEEDNGRRSVTFNVDRRYSPYSKDNFKQTSGSNKQLPVFHTEPTDTNESVNDNCYLESIANCDVYKNTSSWYRKVTSPKIYNTPADGTVETPKRHLADVVAAKFEKTLPRAINVNRLEETQKYNVNTVWRPWKV